MAGLKLQCKYGINLLKMQSVFHRGESAKRSRAAIKGFTLIELLIVVAIIAVVVSISTMALGGALQGMQLTSAGNKVTRLIEAARQRAMAANVQTAVVMVARMSGEELENPSGRAFCLLERGSGEVWKQVREWEVLPDGVMVDLDASGAEGTFVEESEQNELPGGGELPDYLGSKNYQAAFRVFLPSGGMLNPEVPARLQLVNGRMTGGGMEYLQGRNTTGPANYYRITVIGATGKTKVDRP